jgi:uncharacterized ion transporter superfamily protein YfcC
LRSEQRVSPGTVQTASVVPNVLMLLILILLASVVATYFVPGGQYAVTAESAVVPDSYARVESSPVSLLDAAVALCTGMLRSASVVLGILVIGGALAVLAATGSVHGLISRVVDMAGFHKYVVLSIVMVLFGVAAAVGLITSEVVAFFPVGLMIADALRLRPLTGLLIVLLPNAMGYATSFLNPSSLALAQSIAGVPLFSGMGYRVALFALLMLLTIGFVLQHTRKTWREDVWSEPRSALKGGTRDWHGDFGVRHKVVLTALAGTLIIFAIGSTALQWGVGELAACFAGFTLLVGLIFRMSPKTLITTFLGGMRPMIIVALVIVLTRSIAVVLDEGRVLDPIVFALSNLVEPAGPEAGAVAVLVGSGLINFFVPSGTGQAALTMPLIAPLADLWGFSRQLGVLCFQLGDGVTNLLYPTSPVLIAGLTLGNIRFVAWLKIILPYVVLVSFVATAGVIAGVWFEYDL